MRENLSSLLICVFMKSGKSRDDFYVVHPTSCTISLSANIQFSLLTREHFPHTIEGRWRWKRWFSQRQVFLPSHRLWKSVTRVNTRELYICVSTSGKCFHFNGNSLFPRKLFKNGTWVGRCGLRNRRHDWSPTLEQNIYRPIKIVSTSECLSMKTSDADSLYMLHE